MPLATSVGGKPRLLEHAGSSRRGGWEAVVERFCTAFDGVLPLLFVGLVFLAKLGLILGSGETPSFDDREQLRDMTSWAWGYSGVQPPLHTWIVKALSFAVPGDLAAVYAARFLVLLLTLVALYGLAKVLRLGRTASAACMLGAFLMPQVGWEAQRAFSHSLSAMLFSVVFLVAVAAAVRYGSWTAYLMLGVSAALAILGKYNSLILIASAGLALAATPDLRRSIDGPRLAGAGLAAVAVLAAPGLWLSGHWGKLDDSAAKFAFDGFQSFWLDRLVGGGILLVQILGYVAPLLIVAAIGLASASRSTGTRLVRPPAIDTATLGIAAIIATSLAACLVLVLVSGATMVQPYWLHPALIASPAVVAAFLEKLDPTKRALRFLVVGGGTVATATGLISPRASPPVPAEAAACALYARIGALIAQWRPSRPKR